MGEMSGLGTLIERWQAGDECAAEAIYERTWDSTVGLAYALLGDMADAEEVAQDALTYALTHIERYDPERARFSTWLHTITVSRCRNRRRRRLLPSLSLAAWLRQGGEALIPAAPNPEGQAIRAAARDEVWTAIEHLSPSYQEAILLRHWADYTYQEIGQILGCSMRTAQSRVRLAHQRLRHLLTPSDLAVLEENTHG